MLKVFVLKYFQPCLCREGWDAVKPSYFMGAGETVLEGSIYGCFRRHLLTSNKSLELELYTDARRIKSEKTNSPQS